MLGEDSGRREGHDRGWLGRYPLPPSFNGATYRHKIGREVLSGEDAAGSLVDRTAAVFTHVRRGYQIAPADHSGAEEFKASRGMKFKTPFRYVRSALRAVGADTHAHAAADRVSRADGAGRISVSHAGRVSRQNLSLARDADVAMESGFCPGGESGAVGISSTSEAAGRARTWRANRCCPYPGTPGEDRGEGPKAGRRGEEILRPTLKPCSGISPAAIRCPMNSKRWRRNLTFTIWSDFRSLRRDFKGIDMPSPLPIFSRRNLLRRFVFGRTSLSGRSSCRYACLHISSWRGGHIEHARAVRRSRLLRQPADTGDCGLRRAASKHQPPRFGSMIFMRCIP